uniref:Uncharacterized protein n=1 Tax=Rhizophora mucronata TaxID=61149 RepID=A0A2P2NQM1_RHIMU
MTLLFLVEIKLSLKEKFRELEDGLAAFGREVRYRIRFHLKSIGILRVDI